MRRNRQRCLTCYFGDQCPSPGVCDYYTPLVEEGPTEEERRQIYEEYRDAWLEYIRDSDD